MQLSLSGVRWDCFVSWFWAGSRMPLKRRLRYFWWDPYDVYYVHGDHGDWDGPGTTLSVRIGTFHLCVGCLSGGPRYWQFIREEQEDTK